MPPNIFRGAPAQAQALPCLLPRVLLAFTPVLALSPSETCASCRVGVPFTPDFGACKRLSVNVIYGRHSAAVFKDIVLMAEKRSDTTAALDGR